MLIIKIASSILTWRYFLLNNFTQPFFVGLYYYYKITYNARLCRPFVLFNQVGIIKSADHALT